MAIEMLVAVGKMLTEAEALALYHDVMSRPFRETEWQVMEAVTQWYEQKYAPRCVHGVVFYDCDTCDPVNRELAEAGSRAFGRDEIREDGHDLTRAYELTHEEPFEPTCIHGTPLYYDCGACEAAADDYWSAQEEPEADPERALEGYGLYD